MSGFIDQITPVVLSYNEAPNIRRCLEQLTWAKTVVVIDSGSTDSTAQIVAAFPNAILALRPFDNHTNQWNYGTGLAGTGWVLSLDADYILNEAFVAELRALSPAAEESACFASFRYCIGGKPLTGSLYPPRAVLFRKERCHYIPDGHTQLLQIRGPTLNLQNKIDHDDRKPLSRWLASQIKYSELEAGHLLTAPAAALGRIDRWRARAWIMPFLAPWYCILWKGLWRNGLAGWHYTLQRWLAECMIALAVADRRLLKQDEGK
ncbi:MAG: glycosyl transferase [Verrucomicrobiaceae bacterium]|nr:glycosyl transferase [Verrucomicrobiaceae bacterium]